MATFEDFKARYPELVACGDGNQESIEYFLGEYETLHGGSRCEKYADLLQLTYAAHMVSKSTANPEGPEDAPGPITSESVGGVSFSYDTGDTGPGGGLRRFFASTTYGQQYLYYMKMCLGSGVMVAP